MTGLSVLRFHDLPEIHTSPVTVSKTVQGVNLTPLLKIWSQQ
jgi:hypothetical protein